MAHKTGCVRFRPRYALEYYVTGTSGKRYLFKKANRWKDAVRVTDDRDIAKFLNMADVLEADTKFPGDDSAKMGKPRESSPIGIRDVRRRRPSSSGPAAKPKEGEKEAAPEVECPKCGAKFPSQAKLDGHLKEEHAGEEKPKG